MSNVNRRDFLGMAFGGVAAIGGIAALGAMKELGIHYLVLLVLV